MGDFHISSYFIPLLRFPETFLLPLHTIMSDSYNIPTFTYKPIPLTERLHARVYGAINPSRSCLSQAGKTVLITGGSDGIGFAIARNFGFAQADRVIITGKTREKLDAAVDKLFRKHKASQNHCTPANFEGRLCHLPDTNSINRLFHELAVNGVHGCFHQLAECY
jgi:FlaA1/EpsC-like NDP-sugar epimerase